MQAFHLSSDATIEEFECVNVPRESHIREDQMDTPLHVSHVFSLDNHCIQAENRKIPPEEFEIEKQIFLDTIADYHTYIYSLLVGEASRFYAAYCWRRYKEKKGAYFLLSEVCAVVWDETDGEEEILETVDENKENKENKNENESENVDTEINTLHVFDKKQNELRLNMYIEAVYARHVEYYFEKHGEFPDPDEIVSSLREKIERETKIVHAFFEEGEKEESLAVRLLDDDFFFSFDDGYFVFVYGKSCYKFTVKEDDFYLKNKKVDLSLFFKNLKLERKRVWKHSIRLTKLFEKNGFLYNNRSDEPFFLYRIVDEEDLFYIRFHNAECYLKWDKRNFYRLSGEMILNPAILVHEMIEFNHNRIKARLKSKQFFQTFLTKSEKDQYRKKKSVFIEGKEFDYLFCPEIPFNSILRFNKQTKEKVSMCVMIDNPYIPRHDVIASAMLLVKSGNEEQLNAMANTFPLNKIHEKALKKHKL